MKWRQIIVCLIEESILQIQNGTFDLNFFNEVIFLKRFQIWSIT